MKIGYGRRDGATVSNPYNADVRLETNGTLMESSEGETTYASNFERYRPLSDRELARWLSRLMEWGKIGPGARLLDLGCGTGRFAIPVARATGAEVWGVDVSPAMLAEARRKEGAHRVNWVAADAIELGFQDETFDCVLISMALHQFGEQVRTLAEVHRVLKPGGRIIIRTFSHPQLRRMLIHHFFPKALEIDLQRMPSIRQLCQTLMGLGFRIVAVKEIRRTRQYSGQEYVERVRSKYFSALHLLTEEEFQEGLAKLEWEIAPADRVREIFPTTVVVGELDEQGPAATRFMIGRAKL